MNINNNLQLNQSQKMVITTSLRNSLEILNMNHIELESKIKEEEQSNPLLEVEKNNEISWEEYFKYTYKQYNNIELDNVNEINHENLVKYKLNIYEHLKNQIRLYKLNNKEREICEYIIDSLDKDGYLNIDNTEITKMMNIDKKLYYRCLEKIQSLEPSGVGATNLYECLKIQLKNNGIFNENLYLLIENDLNLVANNKINEICKKYKISSSECNEYISIIKNLNPRPCEEYVNQSEGLIYIKPEIIVKKIGDEFVIYLNDACYPTIKINVFYKEILQNSKGDEDVKEFIQENLNIAVNLIKNIENRKNTILKISQAILNKQEEFFLKGTKYINPMTMKEIAQDLNLHESTISRGVNGKYMLTPFGTFELKYFFNSSIKSNSDKDLSSISIKNIIKDKIKLENKRKPLSDENIASILKKEGINIARRTVAKYREELGILSSSKRKYISKNN